jgi:hypothetical protein
MTTQVPGSPSHALNLIGDWLDTPPSGWDGWREWDVGTTRVDKRGVDKQWVNGQQVTKNGWVWRLVESIGQDQTNARGWSQPLPAAAPGPDGSRPNRLATPWQGPALPALGQPAAIGQRSA